MGTQDFLEKDFYAALGVSKDASADEIKKAYRALARTYHPDVNEGDESAADRFKEISEAYDVLSDDTSRREYDEARALFGAGMRGRGAPGPPGSGWGGDGGIGGVNLGDLFGGNAGAGMGDIFSTVFSGGGRRSAARRGNDLETEVRLPFGESVTGTTVAARLTRETACTTCLGSGARAGTTPRVCPVCGGAGHVNRSAGAFALSEPCRECRGRGRIIDDPCPTCGGDGTVMTTKTLNIRVPAGVKDGQRIRLAGRGEPGIAGGPPGDLFVVVHVDPHPVFGRKGDHVRSPCR